MSPSVQQDYESLRESQARAQEPAMSNDSRCRCWTEPARLHTGHCCMATADLWCHQVEGMAALDALEDS